VLLDGRDRIRTNPTGEVETKKTTQGGTECAPVENKSEQFSQLLQAFNALTPDERSALLEALGGAVKSLQL
jgi:DNA-directed RNA polymerase specialized sigma24 family protein